MAARAMKALVVGAAGQVGRALLAAPPAGWTCVGVTRAQLDLTDRAAIRRVIGQHAPDVVINAAAFTAVDRAETEEPLAHAINAEAVAAMAQALGEAGGHLVHVSTDYVFDGTAPRAYLPGDARNPQSAYGRTKAAGEDAAGAQATVVRTAWVYDAVGANFLTTMLRLMRERDAVRVVADQIGAPTAAAGLAQVLWRLAERRAPGIFHHSDAGVASWYDFAVAIQEEAIAAGLLTREVAIVPITSAEYPTPAQRPKFSLLDSRVTREVLQMTPVHWRVGLRQVLAERADRQTSSARSGT